MKRAAEDLRDFRSQARRNYQRLLAAHMGPLKRTKETSASVGISPDTEKSRPAPMKQTARRCFHFAQGKYTEREICEKFYMYIQCQKSYMYIVNIMNL